MLPATCEHLSPLACVSEVLLQQTAVQGGGVQVCHRFLGCLVFLSGCWWSDCDGQHVIFVPCASYGGIFIHSDPPKKLVINSESSYRF